MKHTKIFRNHAEYEQYISACGSTMCMPHCFVCEEENEIHYHNDGELTCGFYDNSSSDYLTFKVTNPGNINWFAMSEDNFATIEYSKNDGEWIEITASSPFESETPTTINVVAGDTVKFRGNNNAYASTDRYVFGAFAQSTCGFELEGNIMSLIYSNDFEGKTIMTSANNAAFSSMFRGCTGLTSAENLILPATTLASSCYGDMFSDCTSLTTAPELPVTTLANYCYQGMFGGCTSLTQAPELPATTLVDNCYQEMFFGCTSLTTAPELPATTLASNCYRSMFRNCTNLNYIKCLATDISASNCTSNWVQGVAATGTFVKDATMSSWTTGNNGIPTGWTVQDAS